MNLPFPVLVLLAASRGQAIHGVRYVIWTLIFSTVFNLVEIADNCVPSEEQIPNMALMRVGALSFVMLLPFDWRFALRAMDANSDVFLTLRRGHLEQLRGRILVAKDIGFVAYFSDANVCDLSGLVNGREVAKLSPDQRMRRCAAENPEAAYLSSSQALIFNRYLNVSGWPVCETMDLKNVSGADTHYLAVPAMQANELCAPVEGPKPPLGQFSRS